LILCLLWLVPTFGLFVSSFRTRDDILTTGWWEFAPHRKWVTVDTLAPPPDIDRTKPMEFNGVSGTFEEFRLGLPIADGRRIIWVGNRRAGKVQVQELQWAAFPNFTLQNYADVLTGKNYEVVDADGVKHTR